MEMLKEITEKIGTLHSAVDEMYYHAGEIKKLKEQLEKEFGLKITFDVKVDKSNFTLNKKK